MIYHYLRDLFLLCPFPQTLNAKIRTLPSGKTSSIVNSLLRLLYSLLLTHGYKTVSYLFAFPGRHLPMGYTDSLLSSRDTDAPSLTQLPCHHSLFQPL